MFSAAFRFDLFESCRAICPDCKEFFLAEPFVLSMTLSSLDFDLSLLEALEEVRTSVRTGGICLLDEREEA